jgi:hypothetical protein
MSYERTGLGTNGSSETIRPVTAIRVEPDRPRELTPEERTAAEAEREHRRTYVEDRIEEAGNAMRQNLRFFRPSSYQNDPYAGLALIMFGIAAVPPLVAGGLVGRRKGKTLKGAAVGLGATVGTAVLAKPVGILLTGRRNPIHDAFTAISPPETRSGSWIGATWPLIVAPGLIIGGGAAYLATRGDS